MTSILTRRSLLRGLFAMPAVVAASSLMPVRGIIVPTSTMIEGVFIGCDFFSKPWEMIIRGIDQWGNDVEETLQINEPWSLGQQLPRGKVPFREITSILADEV